MAFNHNLNDLVHNNDIEGVIHYFKQGGTVKEDVENSKIDGALLIASHNGYIDIVQLLLDQNYPINRQRWDGSTALIEASRMGWTDIIELLLNRGADLNPLNYRGHSTYAPAFFVAYVNQQQTTIKKFIECVTKRDNLYHNGRLLLQQACQFRMLNEISLLVASNASMELLTRENFLEFRKEINKGLMKRSLFHEYIFFIKNNFEEYRSKIKSLPHDIKKHFV